MIEVLNRSRLNGQAFDTVQRVLSSLAEIDHVARFSDTLLPPFSFAGSFAYENHTHDIVVTRPSDSIVLVFDSTCSGRLRCVTVWDRLPTRAELLRERLQRAEPGSAKPLAAACRFGGHVAGRELGRAIPS